MKKDFIDVTGEKIMADTADIRAEEAESAKRAWEQQVKELNYGYQQTFYSFGLSQIYAKYYGRDGMAKLMEVVGRMEQSAIGAYWAARGLAIGSKAIECIDLLRPNLRVPISDFLSNAITLGDAQKELNKWVKRMTKIARESREQYFTKKDELTPEEE